jgi:hypothetical protein
MPRAAKRKISARQIVHDIRAGMDDSRLRQKYDLTDQGLESLYKRLLEKGLLSRSEIGNRHSPPRSATRRSPVQHPPQPIGPDPIEPWACPLCGEDFLQRYEECPKCGAVAAKAESLHHRAHGVPRQYREPYDKTASASSNQWGTVALSLAVLAVIGVAIVAWSSYRSTRVSISGKGGKSYNSGTIKRFTTDSFGSEVLDASQSVPVLVEFYADW